VWGFGPSAVMTVNVALGKRSPTLMAMFQSSRSLGLKKRETWIRRVRRQTSSTSAPI
jgi:hypothetical protein